MKALVSSYDISEFTQQDQEEEDRKTLVCDKRLHGYYLRVLSGSSLEINAFWSFTKRSVQRKVKFGVTFFQQNYRHACHTRLPSPFLCRPVA